MKSSASLREPGTNLRVGNVAREIGFWSNARRELGLWATQVLLPTLTALAPAAVLWMYKDHDGALDQIASGALALVGVFLLFAVASDITDREKTVKPPARLLSDSVHWLGIALLAIGGGCAVAYATGTQFPVRSNLHCVIDQIDAFATQNPQSNTSKVDVSVVYDLFYSCVRHTSKTDLVRDYKLAFSESPAEQAANFSKITGTIFLVSIIVAAAARVTFARAKIIRKPPDKPDGQNKSGKGEQPPRATLEQPIQDPSTDSNLLTAP